MTNEHEPQRYIFFLLFCFKAREKKQREAVNEETTSNTGPTSETVIPRRHKTSDNDNAEKTSNISHCTDFPPLPLPPREYNYFLHKSHHETVPTEDKMGTLHNAIIDKNQQKGHSSSSSQSLLGSDTECRLTSSQPSAVVRFVPRTTHLETRKRKLTDAAVHSPTYAARNNETLIGPKLPEPPKVDMEDESLNTTVSLIRSTMKQVSHNQIIVIKHNKDLVLHCSCSSLICVSKLFVLMVLRWNPFLSPNQ